MTTSAVELAVDDGVAIAPATAKRLARDVARMVRAAALHDRRRGYEVALRLVGDPAMRVLNRDWRGKDKPTDVLAFAQRPRVTEARAPRIRAAGETASAAPELLGDIVISFDTARRQAKRGLYAELLHLASHGLCHLLGYDHPDAAAEREMNARAAALRAEAARRGRVKPA